MPEPTTTKRREKLSNNKVLLTKSPAWTVRQQRLRADLIAEAMTLFRRKGFDDTSVAEVIEHVGISIRTFFRYFRSKDELAFGWLEDQGEAVRQILLASPVTVPAIKTFEIALLEVSARDDFGLLFSRSLVKMILEHDLLSGRFRAQTAAWEEVFLKILLRDQPASADAAFLLRAQIAVLNAAFGAALREWAFRKPVTSFQENVIAAFSAISGLDIGTDENVVAFRSPVRGVK